jgi:hypothetical protein
VNTGERKNRDCLRLTCGGFPTSPSCFAPGGNTRPGVGDASFFFPDPRSSWRRPSTPKTPPPGLWTPPRSGGGFWRESGGDRSRAERSPSRSRNWPPGRGELQREEEVFGDPNFTGRTRPLPSFEWWQRANPAPPDPGVSFLPTPPDRAPRATAREKFDVFGDLVPAPPGTARGTSRENGGLSRLQEGREAPRRALSGIPRTLSFVVVSAGYRKRRPPVSRVLALPSFYPERVASCRASSRLSEPSGV